MVNSTFNKKSYNKNYYQKNKERILETNKRWLDKNKEKAAQSKRAWRDKNIEKVKERDRQYFQDNKERLKKDPNRIYHLYKSNAKRRNKEWSIDYDTYMTFWQKPCNYCGDDIETVGIDRVDNEGSYTLDNIVSCCMKCNMFKNAFPKDEFINHCKKITNYYENL